MKCYFGDFYVQNVPRERERRGERQGRPPGRRRRPRQRCRLFLAAAAYPPPPSSSPPRRASAARAPYGLRSLSLSGHFGHKIFKVAFHPEQAPGRPRAAEPRRARASSSTPLPILLPSSPAAAESGHGSLTALPISLSLSKDILGTKIFKVAFHPIDNVLYPVHCIEWYFIPAQPVQWHIVRFLAISSLLFMLLPLKYWGFTVISCRVKEWDAHIMCSYNNN